MSDAGGGRRAPPSVEGMITLKVAKLLEIKPQWRCNTCLLAGFALPSISYTPVEYSPTSLCDVNPVIYLICARTLGRQRAAFIQCG
jgi:hypothetical protein